MARSLVTRIAESPKNTWQFIKEAREELSKVAWPTRQTTIRYTIVVVLASLALGGLTGGVDYLLSLFLELILL